MKGTKPRNGGDIDDAYENDAEQPEALEPIRKPRHIRRFFAIFGISVAVFSVVAVGAILGYISFTGGDIPFDQKIARFLESGFTNNTTIANAFDEIPSKTNFMLLGVDEDGTRTDTIIIGCYEVKTGRVALISIPRDTYVFIPKERRDILAERGLFCPSDGGMKINEVYHYAGPELGIIFLEKQLEEMTGVKFRFYAKIDLSALKFIVDSVGGVDFYVPQDMKWADFIDLKEGQQHLDGDKAEQLVRYRSYANADIGRGSVQRDFVAALATKFFQSQNIVSSAATIFETYVKYVETNFTAIDAVKYAPKLAKVNFGEAESYYATGHDDKIGAKWVWIHDPAALAELVDDVFYSTEEEIVPESSMGKKIHVKNGGYTAGIAKATGDLLAEQGFYIDGASDYTGSKKEKTRIYVRKKGQGEDLRAYFDNPEIIVDKTFDKQCDIMIVIGIGEKMPQ